MTSEPSRRNGSHPYIVTGRLYDATRRPTADRTVAHYVHAVPKAQEGKSVST